MSVYTKRNLLVLSLTVVLAATGCATSGAGPSGRSGAANLLTRADLEQLDNMDGVQAIERLRVRWLQPRAGATMGDVVLYIDGTRRQSIDDLRTYRTTQIEQMEFMNANDATTRFGTGHFAGAILVTLRR